MVLVRKLFCGVLFGLIFFSVLMPNFSQAQNLVNTGNATEQFYLPTPKILTPPANSTLSGIIVITVYIPPIVIQKVELYANTIFLGLAQPQNSTNLSFNWDTRQFPNGQYGLMARATVVSTSGYPIDTFSPTVPVTVKNTATNIQEPVTEDTTQNTTNQESTSSETSEAFVPKSSTKVTKAETSTPQDLIEQSKSWVEVAKIEFPKASDNQLTKIAYKIDSRKKEYLVFSGIATANSQVNLTIFSQPIIITTRADSSGNWEYIFEKPLEPGQHRVEVEIIKPSGEKVDSGPFNFLIARAQASAYNPTGANLELVDPTRKIYTYYYVVAGAAVVVAFVILLVILYRRRKAKTKEENG